MSQLKDSSHEGRGSVLKGTEGAGKVAQGSWLLHPDNRGVRPTEEASGGAPKDSRVHRCTCVLPARSGKATAGVPPAAHSWRQLRAWTQPSRGGHGPPEAETPLQRRAPSSRCGHGPPDEDMALQMQIPPLQMRTALQMRTWPSRGGHLPPDTDTTLQVWAQTSRCGHDPPDADTPLQVWTPPPDADNSCRCGQGERPGGACGYLPPDQS